MLLAKFSTSLYYVQRTGLSSIYFISFCLVIFSKFLIKLQGLFSKKGGGVKWRGGVKQSKYGNQMFGNHDCNVQFLGQNILSIRFHFLSPSLSLSDMFIITYHYYQR